MLCYDMLTISINDFYEFFYSCVRTVIIRSYNVTSQYAVGPGYGDVVTVWPWKSGFYQRKSILASPDAYCWRSSVFQRPSSI